jgi:hypothetical protein
MSEQGRLGRGSQVVQTGHGGFRPTCRGHFVSDRRAAGANHRQEREASHPDRFGLSGKEVALPSHTISVRAGRWSGSSSAPSLPLDRDSDVPDTCWEWWRLLMAARRSIKTSTLLGSSISQFLRHDSEARLARRGRFSAQERARRAATSRSS